MVARPLAVASAAAAAGAWAGVSWAERWGAVAFGAAALLAALVLAILSRGRWPRIGRASAAVLILAAGGAGILRGATSPRAASDGRLFSWLDDPHAGHGGREPIWIEGVVCETALAEEGARIFLAIERRESAPGNPLEPAPPGLYALLSGPRTLHRGDRIRALTRLHLPEAQRNPGGRDVRREMSIRGVALLGTIDPHGLLVLESGPRLFRALDELRDRFSQRCAELCLTPQRAAIVASLGVGDRRGLDVETDRDLADSGLVHLLSSAGLHLAIVALFCERIFRTFLLRLPWTRRRHASGLSAIAALPIVVAEVLLLGAPWPAVRAGVAAALGLTAPLLSRRFDSLTGLLAGLGLCALWDPASIAGLPLALSFAGVLGLILLAPRLRELVPLRPPPPGATLRAHPLWVLREHVLRLFCASAAAALCTAPWMAAAFHRISLVSALANALGLWPGLLALPLASLAVPVDLLSHGLALPLFWACDLLASLLLGFAHLFAELPEAAIALPAASISAAILWTLSLLFLAGWPAPLGVHAHPLRSRPRTLLLRAAAPLILLVAIGGAKAAYARSQHHLQAIFLSVGQGDSAIIRFPDGSTLLVDAGGDLRDLPAPLGSGRIDPGARDVLPALAELGVFQIDLAVLSHPHPDHAGGFFSVLRGIPVRELWVTGEPGPRDIGGKLARAARAAGARVHTPVPGEVWERGGARVEVLAPDPVWSPDRSTNDNSIVLRVVHDQVALLLAGDVEALGEAQLAQGSRPLRAQLLKAGHHGSRTSSTDAFLRAVAPDSVVFSMGAQNPFGFPHPEVVARMEVLGARTFRTDRGAVIAESDGRSLHVQGFEP